MKREIPIERCRIGNSSKDDFTSFPAFEATIQGDEKLIVGILSEDGELLSHLTEYLKNKFYEAGPNNLILFLNTGLLVAYRKDSKWVQIKDNISSDSNLSALEDEELNELINEQLKKIFFPHEKNEKQDSVDLILSKTFQKLADLIAEDPSNLDNIEWRDLERILGEALSVIGFTVEVTPPSKDGGKDLIASLDLHSERQSFIMEIKHWRCGKKVGKKPVEKFLRVIINEKRAGGLFLSSYGFTEDCTEAIASYKSYNLNLGDSEKMYSIFQMYKKRKDGLLFTPKEMFNELSS